MKNGFIIFLLVSMSLLTCNSKPEMKVDTSPVADFNLEQYLGTWYEIARLPNSFEKNLIGVTATYSLRDDGKISVLNKGYEESFSGNLKSITGKAKVASDPDIGHLKVSFFWIFYADYKILELDKENYSYALVGSSESTLWILSRTPVLSETTYEMLVEEARKRGYQVEKLIKVKQKPLMKPEPNSTI